LIVGDEISWLFFLLREKRIVAQRRRRFFFIGIGVGLVEIFFF